MSFKRMGADLHEPRIEDVRRVRPRDIQSWEFEQPRESFNRVAFAMRVLAQLAPLPMTVAVYERRHELRVDRGREVTGGDAWATVGIPPHATRRHIALALAELAGVARTPFMVDALVAAADDRSA